MAYCNKIPYLFAALYGICTKIMVVPRLSIAVSRDISLCIILEVSTLPMAFPPSITMQAALRPRTARTTSGGGDAGNDSPPLTSHLSRSQGKSKEPLNWVQMSRM